MPLSENSPSNTTKALSQILEQLQMAVQSVHDFIEQYNMVVELSLEQGRLQGKIQALDEKTKELAHLRTLQEELSQKSVSIEKEQVSLRERKLQLDQKEKELKVKQEQISRILSG